MVQAASPHPSDHVLEVGTGSGYGAAVLALLAHDVVTVEIRPDLALAASGRLRNIGYDTVQVVIGDGSLGWPALAPYDVIVTTAATPGLPPVLLEQLSPNGGRLVAPVGSLKRQQLILAERHGTDIQSRSFGAVRFVPLIGAGGFHFADPARRN
jgi:protein-L-isoaspartate(D-aspartate) O-methyltransferase